MEYIIATGRSRTAPKWKNEAVTWDGFVERLASPVVTPETCLEYSQMTKDEKNARKDVGGFVAGSLLDGIRKADNVQWRSMITLDLDNVDTNESRAIEIINARCPYTHVIYPTHSHTRVAPRLRVIIPLENTITSEQYEPVARRLAADIDIDWCDASAFRVQQLMYWPSIPSDLDYSSAFVDFHGPLASGNAILARYTDWRNMAEWPGTGREIERVGHKAKAQENPTVKNNMVGVFCRTYSITEAITTFLADVYTPTNKENRFTFTGGSTVGGLVLYDDLFAFDNHATSPASGQLCNAFDLVRLHKFGGMDESCRQTTSTEKRPSYEAMLNFIKSDERTMQTLFAEQEARVESEFSYDEKPPEQEGDANPDEWKKQLEFDKKGNVSQTLNNASLIISNDPRFKGKLVFDEMKCRNMVTGALPWNSDKSTRFWSDADEANMRLYLEKVYGLDAKEKIETALTTVFFANRHHALREYFKGLPPWDGVKRVETLIIDFLGAEDSEYMRHITKTHLVAGVTRIFRPGAKYDTMITLSGGQGKGKSTFIRILGGNEFFSDSLRDFKGKEPLELLQGCWFIEIAELAAYKKSDKEEFKAFMSKVDDQFRPAYGHNTEQRKRQCIFWGTTNDHQFLRDETGDRRTWPVEIDVVKPKYDVFSELAPMRDQIWAEAYQYYLEGWPIALSREMEEEAENQRKKFMEENPRRDAIYSFLDVEIPTDWHKLEYIDRISYLDGDEYDGATVKRNRITALEIWVECFRENQKYFTKRDAAEINLILANMPGWRKVGKKIRLDSVCYNAIQKKIFYERSDVS